MNDILSPPASSNQDRKWLVRSSGRILGPFNLDELVESLKTRQCSLIDEARQPRGLWKFIREHEELREIARFVREYQLATREDTATVTSLSNQKTVTDVTAEITKTPLPVIDVSAPVKSVTTPSSPSSPSSSTTAPLPVLDSRGVSTPRTKKTSSGNNWFLWAIGGILCGVAFAILFIKYPSKPAAESNAAIEDQIQKYFARGELERTLEKVRDLEARMPGSVLDLKIRLMKWKSQIQLDDSKGSLRNELKTRLSEQGLRPSEKREIEGLLALSWLKEGNFTEAKSLLQAIPEGGRPGWVGANLLVISALQDNPTDLWKRANQLIQMGASDSEAKLIRALAAIWSERRTPTMLREALGDLERLAKTDQSFLLENLFLQSLLYQLLNEKAEMIASMKQLFSQDPQLSRDHVRDPMIDHRLLSWESWRSQCETLEKADPQVGEVIAAYCAWQRGETNQALTQIEKIREKRSNDTDVAALTAAFYLQTSRSTEASVLAKTVPQSRLAKLIEGKLCLLLKDKNCANTAFRSVLDQDRNNIAALTGLAQLAVDNDSQNLAEDAVRRASMASPSYRPLISLEQQWQEQK